jgi:IrrE N-terminal-like domain
MTTSNVHMKTLYNKLKEVGYNQKYIHSVLPDWWDDEIAETPAGFQQASLILGQRFGVRAESLWTTNARPELKLPQGIQFKRRDNVVTIDLTIACAVAYTLARIVSKAFPSKSLSSHYSDAGELRKQLLRDQNKITFECILKYCLEIGIPVIHLHHLPSRAKKMEGMTFEYDTQPIIILTRNRPHGYMLFDLAHELGHISLDHVSAENTIIDQKIDPDSDDAKEREANRFALELLTGHPECKIVPTGKNLNANELANASIRFGEQYSIDPLHIALNYGHSRKHWPVANAALKIIAGEAISDQKLLSETLLEYLDLNKLSEDDNVLLQAHLKENMD